ncbi:MAG: MarC family NAAT transporter [Lautropia sp.]
MDGFSGFGAFLFGGFLSLVTIVNPPATLPIYTSLTSGMKSDEAERIATRASLYCLAIMVVSLFAGSLIMQLFGISYAALRVSGGMVLAILGHGMLYGRAEVSEVPDVRYANPAFFPLALPGITGPGTIAVTIGIATQIQEQATLRGEIVAYAGTLLAMGAVCLLELLLLRSARTVSARLGPTGIEVVTRLSGFLLICVGVQFIASGIKAFIATP